MSPSIAEYFIEGSIHDITLAPRSNFIQSIVVFGDYKIITDYNNEVFIEKDCNNEHLENSLF